MSEDERTISLPGGGPKCPGCGGPSYLVTDGPEDGERPWWCPDCNVRLDNDGEYGANAQFPTGSKPDSSSTGGEQ